MLQIIILSILALLWTTAAAQPQRDLSWGDHNGMFYSLISATDFSESSGAVETISTPDGIRAVGFLDPGDSMDYALNIPLAGRYSLLLRVASAEGGGQLTIGNAETSEIYALFDELPSSGGSWENYQTIGQEITLPIGQLSLQVTVLEAGFNLLWLSLEQLPEEPFEPVESEDPVEPEAPVAPVEPDEPVTPEAPSEPVAPVEPVEPEEPEPVLTVPPTQAPMIALTLSPTQTATQALTPATTPLSLYTEQCFTAGNYLAYHGCDVLPRGVGFLGPLVAPTTITYPFRVSIAGVYLLQIRVRGEGGLNVTCESSGTQYAYVESLSSYRTNTDEDWYTVSSVMSLSVGSHNLQVQAMIGGWSFQSVCLLPVASHSVSCSVAHSHSPMSN